MKKLFLLLLPILIAGCWETENGVKVGQLVKLNKQGWFIKTIEGELIRGSMKDGSGAFGKPFDFTVENQALADRLQFALENQKTVKLHYHKELTTWFARTETSDNSFVDDVEFVS